VFLAKSGSDRPQHGTRVECFDWLACCGADPITWFLPLALRAGARSAAGTLRAAAALALLRWGRATAGTVGAVAGAAVAEDVVAGIHDV